MHFIFFMLIVILFSLFPFLFKDLIFILFHFLKLDDGTWIEDEDQSLKIKANFIISAFGSTLANADG